MVRFGLGKIGNTPRSSVKQYSICYGPPYRRSFVSIQDDMSFNALSFRRFVIIILYTVYKPILTTSRGSTKAQISDFLKTQILFYFIKFV